jgi:uncharacterized protein YqjF (DUF2071 family)
MTSLDRMAPARRDSCQTTRTGEQTWKDLLFVHWAVDVETLRPLVPPALAIDTFDGRAYLGLVPFRMHAVRFGPVHVADFVEVNLRTYVHAEDVPGVFFLSLEAESRLAVWGARGLYRLPYHHARMAMEADATTTLVRSERSDASSENTASLEIRWTVLDAAPHGAAPGTLEHFLTERYALYGHSWGRPFRIRVHHPPWPLRRARIDRLATTIPRTAGLEPAAAPIDLVLASVEGVAVETFAREAVPGPTSCSTP